MSSAAHSLIVEVEAFSDTPDVAAQELLTSAAELLDRVNELEVEYPESFADDPCGPWRISRVQVSG